MSTPPADQLNWRALVVLLYEYTNVGVVRSATVDTVCQLLANAWRRQILYTLATTSEPVSLPNLLDALALSTYGQSLDELPEYDRTLLLTGIHHVHLPKMERSGLIEYNRNHGVIWLADPSPIQRDQADSDPPPADESEALDD